jgi:tRNA modification GTPase
LINDRNAFSKGLPISCRTGEGIEALVTAILAKVTGRSPSALGEAAPGVTAINTRHCDCLRKARGHLGAAIALLESGEPPELVAVELRSSLGDVGEIVGEAGTEEILGKIFSSFCIGK